MTTATVLSALLGTLTFVGSRYTDAEEIEAMEISPGVVGFLATFGVVVATIFLLRNLTGRLRRLDHRRRQEGGATTTAPGDGAGSGGEGDRGADGSGGAASSQDSPSGAGGRQAP